MSKLGSKRTVAVVAAFLALTVGGGAAIAASKGASPTPAAFLDSVAKHLGISSAKLKDATKAAATDQVNADLAAGRITKAQADALKARIKAGEVPFLGGRGFGGHHGMRGPHGSKLTAAATYLGLTAEQLHTKLRSGQSLADVAKAQDKSVDGLKQAMIAEADKKLDQAVKDKLLTAAQAKEMLDQLKTRINEIVNGTGRGGPGGHRFLPGGPGAGGPGAAAPFLGVAA